MGLEAKSLRIGNLVTDEFMQNCSFHVTSIGKTYCTYKGVQEFKSTFNKLKPIPLTEEWLIKAGFDKYGTELKLTLIGMLSFIYDERKIIILDSGLNSEGLYHIKFVHQLQNLFFDLSGEELTFKL